MKHQTTARALRQAALLPTAALSLGLGISTLPAQASVADLTEIKVTARRTEEAAQSVPISMTVFDDEMLAERNVTSAAGLAAYTPSLNVDSRYGPDQASFAIRGFTQDLGTSASVAVYFADVIGPRAGGGQITAGNGAGPGAFFDLQNVQVLKGPQGTLFGRNTTGGVIQIVPQRPTSKMEGYLELSAGNYDMRRTQGVLNLPLTDDLRARFGIDTQKRDGYQKNVTNIGPDNFADVDYLAGRASLIWDVSKSVENYTIATYSKSENNGTLRGLFACNPAFGSATGCPANAAAQGDDFYAVSNDFVDPKSKVVQWQLINTTTWDVSDSFTVKNILSYASFEQDLESALYASNAHFSPLGGVHIFLFPSRLYPGLHTADQNTWVEELQFSGTAIDSKLNWQAGLYYENSRPDDWSGTQAEANSDCRGTLDSTNPVDWRCVGIVGSGGSRPSSVTAAQYKQEFLNQAAYSQATYRFTDEWRGTLGLRYTVDKTHADFNRVTYVGFPVGSYGAPGPINGFPTGAFCTDTIQSVSSTPSNACLHHGTEKSEAPTWLLGLDYLPTPDLMAYVKYSRGYRQGSIIPASPPGLSTFDPEQVDSYDIGAKTSFSGAISGTLNISAFYSELKDQQLQLGFIPLTFPGAGTTAIINAGQSTVKGIELETTLALYKGLTYNLAYTYMESRLDSFEQPTNIPAGWAPSGSVTEGGHLAFAPRHNVVTGLSYNLPLPSEVGVVSVGAQYTFTSDQIATADGPYGTLPSRRLLNLNAGWKGIYGSPFDASLFVTNARDEEYATWVAGLYSKLGAEYRTVGEPRMYGARVRYNF